MSPLVSGSPGDATGLDGAPNAFGVAVGNALRVAAGAGIVVDRRSATTSQGDPMPDPTPSADESLPEPARIFVEAVTGALEGDAHALDGHPALECLRPAIPRLFAAFPDISASCEQVVADGDRVAAYWVLRGTHEGPLFGVAPTGRPVDFQFLTMAQVEDGRVVEFNSESGWLRVLKQIGVLPFSPGDPPAPAYP